MANGDSVISVYQCKGKGPAHDFCPVYNTDILPEFSVQALNDLEACIGCGIDSALVLMLISKAIEKEKVHAYFIPDSGTPDCSQSYRCLPYLHLRVSFRNG